MVDLLLLRQQLVSARLDHLLELNRRLRLHLRVPSPFFLEDNIRVILLCNPPLLLPLPDPLPDLLQSRL